MEVHVENTGPTQRKLSVTVPAAEVEAAFAKAYREVSRSARIPGFRPGKIPQGLLDVHYGAQVKSEVQNDLVTRTLGPAMQESKLDPVVMPRVDAGPLARKSDFSYTAEVEIQPEIELKSYKGLAVSKTTVEVEESEVDTELEEMRKQGAQLVPVLTRDTVEEGDVVMMDYEGTMGGVPFQGGKAEGVLIEIGAEGYLPGFSEGLMGAKVPGERSIPIDFPEDYKVEDLAGKGATFQVKLRELKHKELPALDDEMAKDFGAESLEQLKERIRGAIRTRKEREAEMTRKRELLKGLVDANPLDIPPSLVSAQADRIVAGAAMQVQAMTGQKLQLSREELDTLRHDSTADAEFQVRSGMLLLEVARTEGIEIPDEKLDAEIETMVEKSGTDAERVRAHYADPEHREQLRYRLLEDATVAFLLEHAVDSTEATEQVGGEAARTPDSEGTPPEQGSEDTPPEQGSEGTLPPEQASEG